MTTLEPDHMETTTTLTTEDAHRDLIAANLESLGAGDLVEMVMGEVPC